jgi:hypothetical protein
MIFTFSGILFHHFLSETYRVDSSLCSSSTHVKSEKPHELPTLIPEYENTEHDVEHSYGYHNDM